MRAKRCEPACKPSFVVEGNHLSSRAVAGTVLPPVGLERRASAARQNALIRSVLLRIGFAGQRGSPRAGELLPRLSTLTRFLRIWRYISVALSLRSPSAAVSRYPALWGSDFPHDANRATAQPAHTPILYYFTEIVKTETMPSRHARRQALSGHPPFPAKHLSHRPL